MSKGRMVLLAAALALAPGSAYAQEMADDHEAAVAAASQKWASAYNAGDAAALAALYTENATVMAPGAEPAHGREEIQALMQAGLDAAPGLSVSLETVSVEEAGDKLLEVGRYVMTAADGSHADHGSYLGTYEREGGEWKLAYDIWNSSMPPQSDGM